MSKIMVTVGGSPMAAYLAVVSRKPPVSAAVLVGGTAIGETMGRLAEALRDEGFRTEELQLTDPNDYESVKREVGKYQSDCDCGCDLTGGTATMTLAIADAFREADVASNRRLRLRTFVDEPGGVLRIVGSGDTQILTQLGRRCFEKVNELTALPASSESPDTDRATVSAWLDAIETSAPYSGAPGELTGAFEHWVAACLRLDSSVFHHASMQVKKKNTEFNLSAVALKGHRIFAISCTTATDIDQVKLKGYEVMAQARQLAGGLARSAVACPLSGDDLDKVRNDMRDATGDPRSVVRVFGIEDLRNWLSDSPDLSALEDWVG